MTEPTITCPNCKTEIKLTESLAALLMDSICHTLGNAWPKKTLKAASGMSKSAMFFIRWLAKPKQLVLYQGTKGGFMGKAMSEHVAGIQPSVLKWARKQAGYSLQDVADVMTRPLEVIEEWERERGSAAPTYVQLEKLAYQVYKRPIAVFFFPEPPQEHTLKKSFRTLPDFEIEALATDTRYALRYARSMQLALEELNDGFNPTEKKIYAQFKLPPRGNIIKIAAEVRQYLGVSLDDQTRWGTGDEALKAWRERIEASGIFVFKRSFKQKDISAFCLVDKEFPIIYLNNSTAKTRQIFSLFHEIAHILAHVNGITKQDDRYINSLPQNEKNTEVMCNRFAAEFLVPSSDFDSRIRSVSMDEAVISSLADRYKVSREVVLRKLLDRGLIDKEYYEDKAAQWVKDYFETQPESGGGNYYRTQASYLGDKYLGLVFGKYYQGRLSIEQVADYLGVKTKSVAGLEHVFTSKATFA